MGAIFELSLPHHLGWELLVPKFATSCAPRPQSILFLLLGAPSWMDLDQISWLLPKAIGVFCLFLLFLSLWRSSCWTFNASRMSSIPSWSAYQLPAAARTFLKQLWWGISSDVQKGGVMLLRSLWGQRHCSTIWIASKGKCTFKKNSIFSCGNELCIGRKKESCLFKAGTGLWGH